MPKLSDAIHKVNQEAANRKKPVKRRPYLDNIAPLEGMDNITVVKTKHSNSVVVEQLPEILKAQINQTKQVIESKPVEKIIPELEIGEESAPTDPSVEKETIPEKKLFTLEEETPKPRLNPVAEKKLKPITNYFDEETAQPLVPKQTPNYKTTPPNLINNSPSCVNPKGTLGTDEEDGVDLSLYNIEQFGHTTKTVLFYIFRKAKENKCLVTPPLKKNDLQKECGINFNTIKSVLQRLSHYKFIKLEKFQRGPFGWTRYSIRESLYNQLLYNFDGLMPTQRSDKHPIQFAENNSFEVGEEITLADSLKEIGFNMGHVRQLQKMQMPTDKIQNSLDSFAFDMQDKEFKLKIRSPLAVFMKVAKTEGEYISSRGYVSPEDEILQQMITLKKDRAAHTKKQQDELLNLSFSEWLNTKTKDEINKIAPPSGDYLGPLHKATLKNWFQENVFQE